MKKAFLVIAALLSLSACASSDDLGRGKTGKSFNVSGYSYDHIWNASIKAIQGTSGDQALEVEKNLAITKQEKETGTILASTGMSVLSWGEIVGIYIEPPYDAASHTIEVESRTKLSTNVFANNWEDELIEAIKIELAK